MGAVGWGLLEARGLRVVRVGRERREPRELAPEDAERPLERRLEHAAAAGQREQSRLLGFLR